MVPTASVSLDSDLGLFPSFSKIVLCLQAKTFTWHSLFTSLYAPAWTTTNTSFQTSFSTASSHLEKHTLEPQCGMCYASASLEYRHAVFWGAFQTQGFCLASASQPAQASSSDNSREKAAEIRAKYIYFLLSQAQDATR